MLYTGMQTLMTLQHNMSLLVFMSYLFSAHTFYIGLRNILFPHMIEYDRENRPIRIHMTSRCKFIFMQTIIFLLCLVSVTFVLLHKKYSLRDKDEKADSWIEEFWIVIIYAVEAPIHIIELILIFGGLFVYARLKNLENQRPDCTEKVCSKDEPLCAKCNILKNTLNIRLPIILRVYVLFSVIFLLKFLVHSVYACVRFNKGFWDSSPYMLIIFLGLTYALQIAFSVSTFCVVKRS